MNGYDPEFLGKDFRIDIPWINYDVFADVLKREELRDNYIADYLHYSVVMSKKNRQAYLSACNLDQKKYRSVSGRRWFIDQRIGADNQLDNRYYKDTGNEKNYWDRGHLTRRTAVTWGASDYVAQKASNDSCCYANACLQHKYFNEDEWRIPEKIAEKFDRDTNGRLSIMTGPVFTENDRWFTPDNYNVSPGRVPSGFWKIIYYIDKKKTKAAGKKILGCEAYLVWQDDLSMHSKTGAEQINVATLQITTTELMDLTGIQFSELLYEANPLWYHARDDRDIKEPERYEIKDAERSKGVKKGWAGHVIHDRDDISKHHFKRVSK
jgi:endonuclease G